MNIVGHRKVLIRTVDTDIVVIALSMFQQLDLEELWIEFGLVKPNDGFQYTYYQYRWERKNVRHFHCGLL